MDREAEIIDPGELVGGGVIVSRGWFGGSSRSEREREKKWGIERH